MEVFFCFFFCFCVLKFFFLAFLFFICFIGLQKLSLDTRQRLGFVILYGGGSRAALALASIFFKASHSSLGICSGSSGQ